jgi:signal transduction histidine kinase
MKAFSHRSSGEKQATDINAAILTTITISRSEWKYVAEVDTDLAADLPLVPCVIDQLNQAVLNIIVNAAHAIAEVVKDGARGKGRITVRTRRDGDWAEIAISDTGNGIPEQIRNRVFEPFFSTKDVGKGTGQGLALAHTVVVKEHGGKIWFESEPGRGTTFFMQLPLTPH